MYRVVVDCETAKEADDLLYNIARFASFSNLDSFEVCETDFMAGSVCMLPKDHEGDHR